MVSSRFIVTIDERGRIYLPAAVRKRLNGSVSFITDLPKRRIFLSDEGRYPIDSKGRVFLPADIRRSLGLGSGSVAEIEVRGETNERQLYC